MKKALAITLESITRRKQLDELVLEVEFMLISIIQGAALVSLATSAAILVDKGPMINLLYIIAGVMLILIFWSQSIIHALSFVRWPLDLLHNFLYFFATLIEVVTFGQILNPLKWYACNVVFFVVAGILYTVDLFLILRHKDDMNQAAKNLFEHTKFDQLLGLYLFVPMGLIYNSAAFYVVRTWPTTHVWFAIGQIVLGVGALAYSLKSFKARTRLIEHTAE